MVTRREATVSVRLHSNLSNPLISSQQTLWSSKPTTFRRLVLLFSPYKSNRHEGLQSTKSLWQMEELLYFNIFFYAHTYCHPTVYMQHIAYCCIIWISDQSCLVLPTNIRKCFIYGNYIESIWLYFILGPHIYILQRSDFLFEWALK